MAPAWHPVRTEDGSWTLLHGELGQACHSHSGAWREARDRYAAPTCLRAKARTHARLHLADVGTGVGWNLAAALAAISGTDCHLIVSTFERDAEVLEAARTQVLPRTRAGRPWLEAVHAALDRARQSPRAVALELNGRAVGELRLYLGDARSRLVELPSEPVFDAVWLDAFSPGVDPPLWEQGFVSQLARRMRDEAWLSTYSASLTVRQRLAQAGLRVGSGPRVGRKSQGTLASRELTPPPLPARTAAKLDRRLARAEQVFGRS